MLEKVLVKIAAWCERKGRVLNITGTSPDDVYLIRYYVLNWKWLKLYLHIFLRSDRDDPHDHPWNFWTRMVRGVYTEELFEYDSRGKLLARKRTQRSCTDHLWVKRKATDVHKIVLRRSYRLKDKDQAPMTLFLAGPHIREWGFWRNGQWVMWKKYLGVGPDAKER